ncbi:unnamed protein product [Prorocentrum cordatum]|uniref:PIPK domain-containing protein n=1 Tax=Prorocentrum cordatum TaxID=2364126 RepID=A0ABN9T769_9DINO|nr:unnamed protein product [Polarella glacialis]
MNKQDGDQQCPFQWRCEACSQLPAALGASLLHGHHGRSQMTLRSKQDMDFLRAGEKIQIGEERRARLLATLEMDSKFLASNNIIDYSLLLGIHDLKDGSLPDDYAGTSGAQPLHQRDSGGVVSKDRQAMYFMGVIDILTPYDALKKAEHCAKSIRYFYSAAGISCCPPGAYAEDASTSS